MRNISFNLTPAQVKDRSKTVTRRLGWTFLKVGDILMACEKCMGLKRGEKIAKIGRIEVTNVRRELLSDLIDPLGYGDAEAIKEGFPNLSGVGFVEMFRKEMGCKNTMVTRIEFKYLD